jgi:hypothetical protein
LKVGNRFDPIMERDYVIGFGAGGRRQGGQSQRASPGKHAALEDAHNDR